MWARRSPVAWAESVFADVLYAAGSLWSFFVFIGDVAPRNFIVVPVVKFGRSCVRVPRHALRNLVPPAVREVVRDPRRAESVAAYRGLNSRCGSTAANHAPDLPETTAPRYPLAQRLTQPLYRIRRIGRHQLTGFEIVRQHADTGEMLLDCGRRQFSTDLLDIRGHMHILNTPARVNPGASPQRRKAP